MIAILMITLTLTAYTLGDPGMPGHGITASGIEPRPGIVAAGPWLPFGALVLIDGQLYTVADRGGCIIDPDDDDPGQCPTTSHMDIFMADRDQALRWGRQQKTVTIIAALGNAKTLDKRRERRIM